MNLFFLLTVAGLTLLLIWWVWTIRRGITTGPPEVISPPYDSGDPLGTGKLDEPKPGDTMTDELGNVWVADKNGVWGPSLSNVFYMKDGEVIATDTIQERQK